MQPLASYMKFALLTNVTCRSQALGVSSVLKILIDSSFIGMTVNGLAN